MWALDVVCTYCTIRVHFPAKHPSQHEMTRACDCNEWPLVHEWSPARVAKEKDVKEEMPCNQFALP